MRKQQQQYEVKWQKNAQRIQNYGSLLIVVASGFNT